ncbi:hypothetical protein [Novosphingobium panipatense]
MSVAALGAVAYGIRLVIS